MDITHGEMAEKQLDILIERRSSKGEADPDEREELWKESVRRYNARRREEMRAAWCEHHQGFAAKALPELDGLASEATPGRSATRLDTLAT